MQQSILTFKNNAAKIYVNVPVKIIYILASWHYKYVKIYYKIEFLKYKGLNPGPCS